VLPLFFFARCLTILQRLHQNQETARNALRAVRLRRVGILDITNLVNWCETRWTSPGRGVGVTKFYHGNQLDLSTHRSSWRLAHSLRGCRASRGSLVLRAKGVRVD
jgi:hypothetical protein